MPKLSVTLVIAIALMIIGLAVFILNPIPVTRNSFGGPIINGALGGILVGLGIAIFGATRKGSQ